MVAAGVQSPSTVHHRPIRYAARRRVGLSRSEAVSATVTATWRTTAESERRMIEEEKCITAVYVPVELLIVVDLSSLATPYLPDYAVLFNPTVMEINALASLRPETFIFSFITKGDIDRPIDMTGVVKSPYVAKPFWLANFRKEDWEKVVRKIVDANMWKEP